MLSSSCVLTSSRSVAEAMDLGPAQASVLPDSLCMKVLDSLKVLDKALENYG